MVFINIQPLYSTRRVRYIVISNTTYIIVTRRTYKLVVTAVYYETSVLSTVNTAITRVPRSELTLEFLNLSRMYKASYKTLSLAHPCRQQIWARPRVHVACGSPKDYLKLYNFIYTYWFPIRLNKNNNNRKKKTCY